MTDAEMICTFMSGPKPEYPKDGAGVINSWWLTTTTGYDAGDKDIVEPCELNLDALHEVEARMINMGYRSQIDNTITLEVWRTASKASIWHATAEQKLAALANVLDPNRKMRGLKEKS